ncbi:Sjogren's syndrome/scleroderma autoantigen 1 family protein [Natrarchaeobius oligotrophus]|uniref:Uncharacterized protein n=1 Tax=Natrarchaeobius chitinivorans TaxID=1679083 RepID=A0A3N6MDQ8_NATCH|nr:Sjogren's syndrome/scleroderma autoantigen 1 family protein [Natrarchaeobius chitinivorans]RQH00918.1 hypothetical protein EA472_09865 [Natrarchaeobius chitinivorans]
MSDFDKEAEREKLREKYERDKKEREATQRMSDLLLKGATMTNTHCGTCGDPLFSQSGTTFCPSCHGGPDAVEGQPPADADRTADDVPTEGADADATDAGATTDRPETDEPTTIELDDRDAETGGTSRPTEKTASDARVDDRSTPGSGDEAVRPSEPESNSDRSSPSSSERPPRRSPSPPSAVEGDLESARDSLVRALEKFAREAAATDDPRYATECLEAAREASETLNALR